ncbi:MAG TPA: NTP transferase domain-containing protein [Chthoniobacterales bacterium]|nr:NTP transferase domain-containing protein [Chthoniobacterales bacterium]
MPKVHDAVILMAGAGSRLRASGRVSPKPLVPLLDRPLVSYVIENLQSAGVRRLHAVVGSESEALLGGLMPLIPPDMKLRPIRNREWQKQNGVSLLAAASEQLSCPFFLTMGDHLFDKELLIALLREGDPNDLNLAIDRKIEDIFDLPDAMKIQTRDGRIVAISKELARFDAIDTGVFLCPSDIFAYLHLAQVGGDCSLADGVRLMARDGRARAIDVGDAWWQDVDTAEMLARAEEQLLLRGRWQTSTRATVAAE